MHYTEICNRQQSFLYVRIPFFYYGKREHFTHAPLIGSFRKPEMCIQSTMKGLERVGRFMFKQRDRRLLKSQSYWCSHSIRQAFGQCSSRAKKAVGSEQASELATFPDASSSLLSWGLEKPG